MRTFNSTSVILLVAMVLATAGCGAAKPTEIKVAILSPLSGAHPTFGTSNRDGALLAIKEWNAKGGVLGVKITPLLKDSQCTADAAVKRSQQSHRSG